MIFHKQLANVVYPVFDNLLWRLPRKQKTLYLTFDDGPFPEATERILHILRDYRVSAVFFLSGQALQKYREEVKQLDYSGHRLGNHGFTHVPYLLQPLSELIRQIRTTDMLMNELVGSPSTLFRPPFGMFGPALLKALDRLRKDMILWSLMSYDFKWSPERTLNYLKQNVENGDIIVFHDSCKSYQTTLNVLEPFLEYCLTAGFEFRVISGEGSHA